jgi:competence ComEA-like helix-hairpin-helix protein
MRRLSKLAFALALLYVAAWVLARYLRPTTVKLDLYPSPSPPPPHPEEPTGPMPPAPITKADEPSGGRIDPNLADRDALSKLPGVGPALTERIIAHRSQIGPYSTADDLTDIRGIGPALVDRLRPLLRFG